VKRTVPPSAEIEEQIDQLRAVGVGENPRESLSELAKLGARLIIQRAVEDEFDAWLGGCATSGERTGRSIGGAYATGFARASCRPWRSAGRLHMLSHSSAPVLERGRLTCHHACPQARRSRSPGRAHGDVATGHPSRETRRGPPPDRRPRPAIRRSLRRSTPPIASRKPERS